MDPNVTREEFDTLAKAVKEASDLVKANAAAHKDAVKDLVKEALTNHPGLTPERKFAVPDYVPSQETEVVAAMPKELHTDIDNLLLLSAITGQKVRDLKYWKRFERKAEKHLKAISATGSTGSGSDWVPTMFSPTFQEMIRVAGKVVPLFPVVDMPSNPYVLPIEIGRMTSYKVPENTGDTGQTAIPKGDASALTGKTTLTAVGHATMVLVSKEAQEDSIIAMLPFLQSRLPQVIAEGREDALLNGDTAATHEDSDTHALGATSRRKIALGLRAMANDNSYKSSLATFNLTNIRALRKGMGKYGIMPKDCALIVGINGFFKLLDLGEVTTVDKYGTKATILNGELGNIDGMPVIVSEFVREDLHATNAVYDAAGTTSVMHVVNRNAFVVGERRQYTFQMLKEKYAEYGQDALLATERFTFAPLFPIATNKATWMGYGIAA